MPNLVLTLIGPDRPGLVEAVAQPIAANGGNWLESRMAHLGGKFAGILRIDVPAEKLSVLVQSLRELEDCGLRVVVEESPPERPDEARHLMEIDLEGLDRPGIVREISRVLVEQSINIEELSTERTKAPMSGEALFRARALVNVPDDCDTAKLRLRLERLATDLMVELELAEKD
ncbi:MAG TPA: ACT domain-containing protein [Anaeromyxobacteraceae bacterium]|nr:ACT domain-containing protein [Anaeromyxobacteraceae bacterium]